MPSHPLPGRPRRRRLLVAPVGPLPLLPLLVRDAKARWLPTRRTSRFVASILHSKRPLTPLRTSASGWIASSRLRQEHKRTWCLAKAERKLETLAATNEAWWEAAQTTEDANRELLAVALAKAEARFDAKNKLLSGKADMALRDVASLRAEALVNTVHRTTLGRELALLDGTVGFLALRLAATRDELARVQQSGGAARADERIFSSAAKLEVQRMQNVVNGSVGRSTTTRT